MSETTPIPHPLELLKARRTIHLYTPRDVPQEWVDAAVEAAHYAPNHKHTWPWRFTQIGPETKARINELALKMKSTNGPLDESALALFNKKRVHPQLMVVSQVRNDDPTQSKEDYAAVSCAIHNFTLALATYNVGSKWSTGSMTRHPIAYELAHISSDAEEIVGFLWYGFAAKTPAPRRPDVSEIYRFTP